MCGTPPDSGLPHYGSLKGWWILAASHIAVRGELRAGRHVKRHLDIKNRDDKITELGNKPLRKLWTAQTFCCTKCVQSTGERTPILRQRPSVFTKTPREVRFPTWPSPALKAYEPSGIPQWRPEKRTFPVQNAGDHPLVSFALY